MIQNFELPMDFMRNVPDKLKKEVAETAKKELYKIYTKNVEAVYAINSHIRRKGNYVPLEEMKSAIAINLTSSPKWKIEIFIDESKISWTDKSGEPVHQVNYPGENKDLNGALVTSLDEHWRTPIERKQESTYYTSKTMLEMGDYLTTDFLDYVVKRIKEVNNGGRKK